MRRGWSTGLLALVLVGLAGYIYFVDSKREPAGSTTKEKLFASARTEDVEELQVKNADGEASHLQKVDGKWQLVDPVKAAADEGEASSIASSVTSLEIQRVVDENAGDLKQYGLEPARLEVGFKAKGDKEFHRVLIGEKTPTGSDLYARAADSKRVFLLSSYLDSTFNKSTFSLRDRRILVFDQNAVDGLELTSGTFKATLTKSGAEWRLASPISARADFAAVQGALGRLNSTQMQSIADADGKALGRFGLDRPTSTIVVVSGSSRATLTFGKTDNALLFARDSSRPMVFTVAPVLKDDVIRTVSDFRRKDLFDSRAFTATRAEFTRGTESLVLEKTKGKDDADVWKASGKDVDASKADDLLSKVTGLRADSFEDQPHAFLKTPALVVTITFDDKKQETVTLVRSGMDVFAARKDEPGSAKLMAAGLDDVMKALDSMK
jgi:hypothetical protein